MYNRFKKYLPSNVIIFFSRSSFFVKIFQRIYNRLFSSPKILQLHITDKCNYNCSYCYAHNRNILFDDWNRVIHEAALMNIQEVGFLGGEPLLDANLKIYIENCLRHKINVKIFTNGSLLNGDWISYFIKIRKKLTIVVKMDCQDCYEEYSAKGKFKNVLENIRACAENRIPIIGHVVITGQNYSRIGDIISLGKSLDIPLEFERYMPILSDIDQILSVSATQWNFALTKIDAYRGQLVARNYARAIIRGSYCSCYIELLSIDVEGDVLPCPLAKKEQKVGSIVANSLESVWEQYVMKKSEWENIPSECHQCDKKLACHGGCKTHTFIMCDTYNAKDPLCDNKHIPTSGL